MPATTTVQTKAMVKKASSSNLVCAQLLPLITKLAIYFFASQKIIPLLIAFTKNGPIRMLKVVDFISFHNFLFSTKKSNYCRSFFYTWIYLDLAKQKFSLTQQSASPDNATTNIDGCKIQPQ
jgi:hypothetical protein